MYKSLIRSILLFLAFVLAGCAVPDYGYQSTVFNDDLSGTFTVLMGYDSYNYSLLQDSYGTDPSRGLASAIADNRNFTDYTYDTYVEDGYWNIEVDAPFDSIAEFESFFSLYDIGLSESDYPGTLTEGTDDLFRREYVHEGTWYSGEQNGFDSSWSNVSSYYYAKLPGRIIDTDGDILDDGQTVGWQLFHYSHTPYRLVTEVRRVSTLSLAHTIQVEDDLSGTYTLGFGFQSDEYENLTTFVGTTNPANAVAGRLAQRVGWSEYDYNVRQQNGQTWLEVTAPFANAAALQSLYGDTASISLSQDEDTYRLTATPITLFTQEINDISTSFLVQLPGEVLNTNGKMEGEDMAVWTGTTPLMEVESKASAFSTMPLIVGALGLTFLGSVGVAVGAVVLVLTRRNKALPAPQTPAVLVEHPVPPTQE